jgi:hypothetical protein
MSGVSALGTQITVPPTSEGDPKQAETTEKSFWDAHVVETASCVWGAVWDVIVAIKDAVVWVWNTVFCCGCCSETISEEEQAWMDNELSVKNAIEWFQGRHEDTVGKKRRKEVVLETKTLRKGEAEKLKQLGDVMTRLSPESWEQKEFSRADIALHLTALSTKEGEGEAVTYSKELMELYVAVREMQVIRKLAEGIKELIPADQRDGVDMDAFFAEGKPEMFVKYLLEARTTVGQIILATEKEIVERLQKATLKAEKV